MWIIQNTDPLYVGSIVFRRRSWSTSCQPRRLWRWWWCGAQRLRWTQPGLPPGGRSRGRCRRQHWYVHSHWTKVSYSLTDCLGFWGTAGVVISLLPWPDACCRGHTTVAMVIDCCYGHTIVAVVISLLRWSYDCCDGPIMVAVAIWPLSWSFGCLHYVVLRRETLPLSRQTCAMWRWLAMCLRCDTYVVLSRETLPPQPTDLRNVMLTRNVLEMWYITLCYLGRLCPPAGRPAQCDADSQCAWDVIHYVVLSRETLPLSQQTYAMWRWHAMYLRCDTLCCVI